MSSYEQTRLANVAGSTINPATEEGQADLLAELELKADLTETQPVNDAAVEALITLLTDLIESRGSVVTIPDALNVQIGPQDSIEDKPTVISHTHNEIHEGNTYKALSAQSLGTSTVQYAVSTGAEVVHMVTNCDVYDGSARVDIYKLATFTGGSARPINNRNLNSSNTPLTSITGGVASSDGTLIDSFYVGSANKSAGQGRKESEWVLVPSSIYRIDVVGLVAGTQAIVSFNWYN